MTSFPVALPASFWRYGLFLFLAVVVLSMPQTAFLPLLDRDEPHFAEASREMLQSGDIVVPTFNHAPRYNKPPLIYWCEALAYPVLGENAFAARLPSVLATAGTAVILLLWGTQLASVSVGFGAALAYAFCEQTMQQGRVATADGLLIFFMTLTVYAGWRVITEHHASHKSRSYFWDTILALGFAGGFLAKGPEAFLPLIPMLIFARSGGRNVTLEVLVNFLLGALIVLFWAVPAYLQTHGDYWRVGMTEGVTDRMVTGMQGHGTSTIGWYIASLFFYVLLFWISTLPWSPLLIIERRKLFTAWQPDVLERYLLLNIGLIFLIFTLMVTKLPHYTLPAFPFIALIFARRWQAAGLASQRLVRLGWIAGIALALISTSAAIFVPLLGLHQAVPSPSGTLVREAQADGMLKPETVFAMVDFTETSTIWEMRRVVTGYGLGIDPAHVVSFLNEPNSRAVVLTTPLWDKLKTQPGIDSNWKIYQTRGFNAGKFAPVDLTLVVKP